MSFSDFYDPFLFCFVQFSVRYRPTLSFVWTLARMWTSPRRRWILWSTCLKWLWSSAGHRWIKAARMRDLVLFSWMELELYEWNMSFKHCLLCLICSMSAFWSYWALWIWCHVIFHTGSIAQMCLSTPMHTNGKAPFYFFTYMNPLFSPSFF